MVNCPFGKSPRGAGTGEICVTDTTATPGAGPERDTSFFGHPKGLAILFMTEMWERFSYYGMRALLIFYLTQHFLFSDQRSALIYGAYTALVYVMPVIGGMLADRYLGSRKAVTFGAILLVLGHFGMAFEGNQAQQHVNFQGSAYEIVTEGRGDDAQRVVMTESGESAISFTGEGIVVDDPGTTGLPALLPAGEYEMTVTQNPTFLMIFYLSLALIISGVGFLKANISTIVGALYEPGDARRDAGFTIFYMGINLGSFIAVLACGYLGQVYGWAYGFGLAGIGMLLGLVVFQFGQGWLQGKADPPEPAKLKERAFGPINKEVAVYLGGVLMVLVSWLLIMNEAFVGDLLNGFGLLMMAVIIGMSLFVFGRPADGKNPASERLIFILGVAIMAVPVLIQAAGTLGVDVSGLPAAITAWPLAVGAIMVAAIVVMDVIKIKSVDRDRMLLALFLILLQLPFWALFEQAGSSLNLFTDRAVDRTLFGFEIPASWFQSLNAGFIFILAPLFAWLWIALAKRNMEPNTVVKFGLGILQVGLGFIVLVQGINMTGTDGLTPMIWVVLIYLLHTTGELCLSPVGLSMVTKLSVPRVVGMMMGAWFLASGFGNYVAGVIAASTGAETVGGEIVDLAAAKANYATVYWNVGLVAVGIAVAVFILSPFLKKLGHGRVGGVPHPTETEAGGPSMDRSSDAP
jgi:POT family proton-dependent oligopeptide transporter